MADVVNGEASESDEETYTEDFLFKPSVLAIEVLGEAAESDEDVYEKNQNVNENSTSISLRMEDLLQKKLINTNLSLWKSSSIYIRNFVCAASKQLLCTDQLLIKSQVSIQSVISSLNMTRSNIKQLRGKSGDAFTTSFVPIVFIQTANK